MAIVSYIAENITRPCESLDWCVKHSAGVAPNGMKICLHKDENAANNQPDNLKWGTQKENLNCPKFIAYCKTRTGENNPYVKGTR